MNQYAISLGKVVDNILKNAKNKPAYLEMFSDWKIAVGENIASKSAPYKVINVGSKKILVIKSKKGYALELQHESQFILEKIHSFLKGHFFDQVKIIQMDANDQIN